MINRYLSKISYTPKISTLSFIRLMFSRAFIRIQKRKILRKLWNFPDGKINVILSVDSPETSYCKVPSGDNVSGIFICSDLIWLYHPDNISIYFSNKVTDDDLKNNLILIGNPSKNEIVKRALYELKRRDQHLEINFDSKYESIFANDKQYFTKPRDLKPGGLVKTDYGMIIKVKNPFNPDKILFIISGIRTYGITATGLFLGAIKSVKAISNEFGDGMFQLLIRADLAAASPVGLSVEPEYPPKLGNFKISNPFMIQGETSRGEISRGEISETMAINMGTEIENKLNDIKNRLKNLTKEDIKILEKRLSITRTLVSHNFLIPVFAIFSSACLFLGSILTGETEYSKLGLVIFLLGVLHQLGGTIKKGN